ncbi:MAG: ATP synthase F0 subunit B [Deltaproteobacteria bacterium]|nr:ATP synthase F0 subunit B [Deltaproteobacteria bacterium]MBW2017067.1 ATP synthase F0 subunit B [Deltaproteobacteria bacterium]MBW2127769.1 ATP synthase F0 subunit B [Deltaproteobacteria bacterium]MBW2303171.1 ATP synthase F0 subunit B [Deltaproteobacteria bacterium]
MAGKGDRARRFLFLSLFVVSALAFLCGGIAVAAEGHGGGDRSADLIDLAKRILNFVLLMVILIWAVRKSGVKEFFSSRSAEIKRKLEELKREKEEAESKFRDVERRLKEFEAKKRDILEQFKAEGIAEKERIIAEAKERVKTIIEQAELTIQQEMKAAKERLKSEVVDLAAEKAREIIASELTEKDQDHLVDEFIERVEKIH